MRRQASPRAKDRQRTVFVRRRGRNHSLATAKNVLSGSNVPCPWSNGKSPARYALVEVVNLHDETSSLRQSTGYSSTWTPRMYWKTLSFLSGKTRRPSGQYVEYICEAGSGLRDFQSPVHLSTGSCRSFWTTMCAALADGLTISTESRC
jgi:hypothetical protein